MNQKKTCNAQHEHCCQHRVANFVSHLPLHASIAAKIRLLHDTRSLSSTVRSRRYPCRSLWAPPFRSGPDQCQAINVQ